MIFFRLNNSNTYIAFIAGAFQVMTLAAAPATPNGALVFNDGSTLRFNDGTTPVIAQGVSSNPTGSIILSDSSSLKFNDGTTPVIV